MITDEDFAALKRENEALWYELRLKRPLAEMLLRDQMRQCLGAVVRFLREADKTFHAATVEQLLNEVARYDEERAK